MMQARGAAVPIPTDVVCGKAFAADTPATTKAATDVADDDLILDIGPKTAAALRRDPARGAGTIVWNGPVGVFEFDAVRAAARERSPTPSRHRRRSRIAGGGDTLAAIAKYGVTDAHRLHLHRRRRVPRIPRRQDAAARCEDPRIRALAEDRHEPCNAAPRSSPPSAPPPATPACSSACSAPASTWCASISRTAPPQDHIKRAELVREVCRKVGRAVGIMADLQGPKIRVGKFKDGKVQLKPGDAFILDAALRSSGDTTRVGLDYKDLPRDVKRRRRAAARRRPHRARRGRGRAASEIHTVTRHGGVLSNNKGINRQGGGLTAPALTAKDMDDIRTAAKHQGATTSRSRSRRAAPTCTWRASCCAPPGGKAMLIAKIERAEAIPGAGGDHACLRRHHGGARRPRGRSRRCRGAGAAEAHDPAWRAS